MKVINVDYKATPLSEDGKYEEAIKIYNEAMQIKSDGAEVYFYRGNAYYKLVDNQQAIEYLTKYLESEPNDVGAYYLRGGCYQALADKSNAEADYAKVRELRGNKLEE